MLRQTIKQLNEVINDMQKQKEEEITKLKEQYEQQMLDMTSEFEYEVECIVNKREKQIKELEEKLDFKELLLKEFNENMDEKIKTIHALEDKIEELEDKMDGMKFGYENKIAKLKEEKTHFIYVDNDPTYDNEPEPEEKVEEVKNEGGDAVEDFSQYITVTIPDEYKDNNEIKDLIKTSEERWNKSHRKQTIKHMNDQILVIIARLEAQKNTDLKPIYKGKDVIGMIGQITIDGVTYNCKYTKSHVLPMLCGCFNMDHIKRAKEIILSINQSLQPTEHAFRRQDNMYYDFDNKIVVYIEDDGSYKGYNDKEMFVWDSVKYPWPSRRTFAHAIDNTAARSFKGTGAAAEQRGQMIMEYIREHFMNTTKDNTVKVTKESQTTNDDYLETDDEDL